MAKKTVEIDGHAVVLRASADTPRIYRAMFGRDVFSDMARLAAAVKGADPDHSELAIDDLSMFEQVTYVMALQGARCEGAEPVPDSIDEWLDQFEFMSIYETLPALQELWNMTSATTSSPKKGQGR